MKVGSGNVREVNQDSYFLLHEYRNVGGRNLFVAYNPGVSCTPAVLITADELADAAHAVRDSVFLEDGFVVEPVSLGDMLLWASR